MILLYLIILCILYYINRKPKHNKMLSQIIREKAKTLDTPFYNKLVDKYTVREVVKKRSILKLPKLYSVFDNENDVDLNSYPNNFVFKCNNGSGMVIIVKDKKIYGTNDYITEEYLKQTAKKWLNSEFWKIHNEVQYKNIKNKIIVEELLLCKNGKIPEDIKMYLFNGKCKLFMMVYDRGIDIKVNYYDSKWNLLNAKVPNWNTKKTNYKPKNLNSLIIESEKLCKGIDFVRLDVYDVDGVYYFGEFTFTPMGGNRIVEDDELEKKWGSWVN
tara:strand:- start:704 stop:1519 length:816 start_codon:yes stop_codon:yes gene_type:complete